MSSRAKSKTNRSASATSAWFLLLLAFVEGGSVMACELIGARLTAPYFGSSLHVWAAVLGVTLTALMGGYYAGGFVSEKFPKPSVIYGILTLAGALLIVMPALSQWIMTATIGMSVRTGATLSLAGFMLPPLFFMGMSSPVIINLLNNRTDTSGKTAGSVYAISTLGGIVSTFALGFYLMPEFGLRLPAAFFGATLVTLSAIGLILQRKAAGALGALLLACAAGTLPDLHGKTSIDGMAVLEIQEGVLGQIKVVEISAPGESAAPWRNRLLFVNNIPQTIMSVDHPERSMTEYIFAYAAALSSYPPGSKALVLGLGGGALLRHFDRFGFDTDIVEMDPRIREVAVKYFGVDPRRKILIDDARHYLNLTRETYDIIALDLFASETPPSDVLSLEGLRTARQHLRPGGTIAINFTGWLTKPQGRVARSLIKTLRAADLQVRVLKLSEGGNILILAGVDSHDFSKVNYAEAGTKVRLQNLEKIFSDLNAVDFSDARLLDDNHSLFETLYADAALEWRAGAREQIRSAFTEHGLQMVR